jgi:hypothetical protein
MDQARPEEQRLHCHQSSTYRKQQICIVRIVVERSEDRPRRIEDVGDRSDHGQIVKHVHRHLMGHLHENFVRQDLSSVAGFISEGIHHMVARVREVARARFNRVTCEPRSRIQVLQKESDGSINEHFS